MNEVPMASREKYWSEKSVDEKLETLRREVKTLGKALWEATQLMGLLEKHSHDQCGRIVAPLKEYDDRRGPYPWQYRDGTTDTPF